MDRTWTSQTRVRGRMPAHLRLGLAQKGAARPCQPPRRTPASYKAGRGGSSGRPPGSSVALLRNEAVAPQASSEHAGEAAVGGTLPAMDRFLEGELMSLVGPPAYARMLSPRCMATSNLPVPDAVPHAGVRHVGQGRTGGEPPNS